MRKRGFPLALPLSGRASGAWWYTRNGPWAPTTDTAAHRHSSYWQVGREALAALRLFREAAEREEATAELARRILRFLYRARYDQSLRFNS